MIPHTVQRVIAQGLRPINNNVGTCENRRPNPLMTDSCVHADYSPKGAANG